MDAASHKILHDLVRTEGRSLLQYISESSPYTTARSQDAFLRLMEMARDESAATAKLAQFMQKMRLRPPYLGAYRTSFTTINFVTLEHLLPQLVEYNRGRIEELEKDLAACGSEPARNQIRPILDLKRRQVQGLEEMAAGIAV